MKVAPAIKAAIFDLDGTLIDSMGVWDKIGQDFLDSRGLGVPDDLSQIVKNMSFHESANYYIRRFALPERPEQLITLWNNMAYREYAENIELKPGVREYLSQCNSKNIKMGIATATDRELVLSVLSRHKILEYFKTIVTVAEIRKSKENPDIFLTAAEKLGTNPPECIVFEDCLHAVKGAKKAGMTVWAVYDPASEHEKAELERIADCYIFSFRELL